MTHRGASHNAGCSQGGFTEFTEGSLLEGVWIEADIFELATVRQILECRYYERVVSAHVISLQALFSLYQNAFIKENQALQYKLEAMAFSINEACHEGEDEMDEKIRDSITYHMEEIQQEIHRETYDQGLS